MMFITGPLYSGKRTFARNFREVGGGVVPMDAEERAGREAAGRLACLLAERADCVVQMFCGIPTVLKGELPQC